jgi:hypothetical protein
MKDWINRYTPGQFDGAPASADGAADNALWAADVWYSIKRHWCLEAQRLIRAKRATLQGGTIRTTGPTQGREDARAVE